MGVNNMVYDHLGNKFNTQKDMCTAYGIDGSTFRSRIKSGLSLEEALTRGFIKPSSKECYDHLGNRYNSILEMCDAYGIDGSTFRSRIKSGLSLEEALTKGFIQPGSKECYDHLGNKYNSILEMCAKYNITDSAYRSRIRRGWNKKDALTKPFCINGFDKTCYDHLGNKFNTQKDMCIAYGIEASTFRTRISSGLSLEEALTSPLGYKSYKDNADNHKIIMNDHKTVMKDHNGTPFISFESMCKYWKQSSNTVKRRLQIRGMTLKDALETPAEHNIEFSMKLFGVMHSYESLREISNSLNISYEHTIYVIHNIDKFKHYDSEIAFYVNKAKYIKLQFISIDNKAWYSVSWSDKLQNTRQILEHCRPDLISLYDRGNPKGEWNPLIKE